MYKTQTGKLHTATPMDMTTATYTLNAYLLYDDPYHLTKEGCDGRTDGQKSPNDRSNPLLSLCSEGYTLSITVYYDSETFIKPGTMVWVSADADFNTPTGDWDAQLSISEYSYLVDGETKVAAMFTMVNSLALSIHNDIS